MLIRLKPIFFWSIPNAYQQTAHATIELNSINGHKRRTYPMYRWPRLLVHYKIVFPVGRFACRYTIRTQFIKHNRMWKLQFCIRIRGLCFTTSCTTTDCHTWFTIRSLPSLYKHVLDKVHTLICLYITRRSLTLFDWWNLFSWWERLANVTLWGEVDWHCSTADQGNAFTGFAIKSLRQIKPSMFDLVKIRYVRVNVQSCHCFCSIIV